MNDSHSKRYISRRDFIKYTATAGVSAAAFTGLGPKVLQAAPNPKKSDNTSDVAEVGIEAVIGLQACHH